MSRYLAFLAVATLALVSFLGFQGKTSKDTPVYVFDDMDYQNKYKAQGENALFADGRDARPPVAGTVARGTGLEPTKVFSDGFRRAESMNPVFVTGKDAKGAFLPGFPEKSLSFSKGQLNDYKVSQDTLNVGRGKYQIYCAVCHGDAGDGLDVDELDRGGNGCGDDKRDDERAADGGGGTVRSFAETLVWDARAGVVGGLPAESSDLLAGVANDTDSQGFCASADGRFVAFRSQATNLVPGDTNGWQDIFVRDLRSGASLPRRILDDVGIVLERLMSAQHVVVAGDDADIGRLAAHGQLVAQRHGARHHGIDQ